MARLKYLGSLVTDLYSGINLVNSSIYSFLKKKNEYKFLDWQKFTLLALHIGLFVTFLHLML
jgi:hypothetical protein